VIREAPRHRHRPVVGWIDAIKPNVPPEDRAVPSTDFRMESGHHHAHLRKMIPVFRPAADIQNRHCLEILEATAKNQQDIRGAIDLRTTTLMHFCSPIPLLGAACQEVM
jgi:hypothetical protein